MATSSIQLIVDATRAINPLRQTEQATKKLEAAVGQTNDRLRDAKGRFIAAGNEAEKASKKINMVTAGLQRLAGQLVAADLVRRYFQGFNEADKAAAAVRTLGVDSGVLERQLLTVSNRLGGLYSQTQLLAASYDVASAGFANAADNATVLEAAALGATGGLSDLNTVGNALTSVLNAYGKSADQAALLVDGFIQTQNDGKIVLNEYAQQIGRLAPTAAAAGVGINELNAAVATITAQGVPVEATFTGLNQALVSILKPSKEASDLAQSLGIEFNESGLRAKGFGGLLEEVKTKTGGSTTALVKLFGSVDALKVVLPLVNDDLVKYNKNLGNQAKSSGTAQRATQDLGGTVSSEITKMVNQIGNLTRALDTVLGPVLGTVIKLINQIIARATEGINLIGQLISLSPNTAIAAQTIQQGGRGGIGPRALMGIDELIGGQRRQQLQRQAGAGTGFLGLGMNNQVFLDLLKKEPAVRKLLGTAKPSGATTQTEIDPRIQAILDQLEQGGGTGRKGGASASERAAKQAAEREKEIQERLRGLRLEQDLIKQTGTAKQLQYAAERAGDKQLLIRLQGEEEINRIANELALTNVGITDQRLIDQNTQKAKLEILNVEAETQRQLAEDQRATNQRQMDDMKKFIEQQYELNTAIKQQRALADGIASVVGQNMATAFDALISGAKSWQQSLQQIASGVLIDIAKQLFQIYVIEQAINAIRSFLTPFNPATPLGAGGGIVGKFGTFGPNYGIPQRANGGSVMSGQSYLVGERGPELFTPGRSGGIAPSGSFGGSNITVNVDASGSSVQGNQPDAAQLGRAIGAAVQAELIKQKRPGGLLA